MELLIAASMWYDILSEYDFKCCVEAAMVARFEDMVQAGIMEQDEIFFRQPYSLEIDWQIMMYRMEKMKPDCPQVWEANKLPAYKKCIDNYWLSDRYHDKLMELRPFLGPSERDTLDWYLIDLVWRREVWYQMYRIQMGVVYDVDGRRLHLQRLKEILKGAWDSGIWPDPLPDCAYKGPWSIDKLAKEN